MDVAESKGTPILDELRRTNRLEKYILALSWEEDGQLVGKFVNFSTLGYYIAKIDSKTDPYMKYKPSHFDGLPKSK